jgi:uncharacterized membrane protein YpjA
VVFLTFGCYLRLSTEKVRLKSIWFYLNDMSCYSDQFPTYTQDQQYLVLPEESIMLFTKQQCAIL